MTTTTVPRTSTLNDVIGSLKAFRADLGNWIEQTRISRQNARIEAWNAEHRTMLESRGQTPYK